MLPFSEVSLLAVLLSTFACMTLGMIWYGPLFVVRWAKLNGIKVDKNNTDGMALSIVCGLINTFVMVYGVGLLLALTTPSSIPQALITVAAIWIGFSATVKGADSIWARKPWQLFWIDSGYGLLAVLISTLIIMSL
ncbi:MAG: DUF1761 domain-containing protein [Candidatus Altimarinota bacterium]